MKTVYYFFLSLALACGVCADAADKLSVSDIDLLEKSSFNEAYKMLKLKHVIYIENPKYSVPQEGELRHDLYEQASYSFVKNPQVRKYYENFFKVTPHTISTAKKRARVFRELDELKSEWAIRLLAQEMMMDRQGQDVSNDPDLPLTEDEVVALISDGRSHYFLRNDRESASLLHKKKLRGMPDYDPYTGTAIFLESMRKWHRENKHQLDKLVYEKWGNRAVLNKDMPDYRMEHQPKSEICLPERKDIGLSSEGRKSTTPDTDGKHESQLKRWCMWGCGGVAVIVLCCYLLRMRKAAS